MARIVRAVGAPVCAAYGVGHIVPRAAARYVGITRSWPGWIHLRL